MVKKEKKEILGKLETQGNELKRKIEMETNEIRFEDIFLRKQQKGGLGPSAEM